MGDNIVLQAKGLNMNYGDPHRNSIKAIDNLNMFVQEGEFVGVMGSSGSGKSTLINILATVLVPTSGNVILNGTDISRMNERQLAEIRNKKIGIVFQEYNLLDTLTIYENIAIALMQSKASREETKNAIFYLAEKLKIVDILNKYPYEVSGGQKQRCACARALIKKPDIILADEPTGALDTASSRALLDSLQMMVKELSSTILMVTHDPLAACCCDRVLIMQDGRVTNSLLRNNKDKNRFLQNIIKFWGGV